MTSTTPNLGLIKATGSDKDGTYLKVSLAQTLDILDGLPTLTSSSTLANKTLTSPHMTGPVVDSGGLTITAGGFTVTGDSRVTGSSQFPLTLRAGSAAIPFASALVFQKQDGTQLWQFGSSLVSGTVQAFAVYDSLRGVAPLSIDAVGVTSIPAGLIVGAGATPTSGAGQVAIGASTRAPQGGATATLGTIGGTGPTTAGMNLWLQISVNGSTGFIPVWL